MPELPEVQTIVDDLKNNSLIGANIRDIDLFWPGTIAQPSPSEFCRELTGQIITDVARRGKWILLTLQDCTLLIHLRMSGRVILGKNIPPTAHERVRIHLADQRILRFEDQRKFGKMYLLKDPAEKLEELGVEPLSKEFTPIFLQSILKRRTKIKPLLLNQNLIAGLGNIYVDEALWKASIHPENLALNLTVEQADRIQISIQEVLLSAIELKGTSLGEGKSNFHGATGFYGKNKTKLCVYGREGEPCFRCRTPILKVVLAGRGTHYCPRCQFV